jgi:DNA-binding helix-hairpin-helix protein with protein kinase domain
MIKKMKNMSGQTITTVSGNKIVLTEEAGRGGQGVVYNASDGRMVKLYYPSNAPQIDEGMIEKLRNIMGVKIPKNFVKIYDLIKSPYVGYVMERVHEHVPLNSYLIPPNGEKLTRWYNAGLGFRGRLLLGYFIARAFEELSADNLAYCDISGNNILIKVTTSGAATKISVRMIDIDNIYVAGRGAASILGTPRYIAPEIISKKKNPDVFSDNYSLAVILFELLRVGHPYVSDEISDGTPEDEEAAYAGKKEYVTDANSQKMLPTDAVFTEKLKELFKSCFVEGKNNRVKRPRAKDFQFALLEASNKVIKCQSCGAWHYPRKKNNKYECPWCDAISKPKAVLYFYDRFEKTTGAEEDKIFDEQINSYILREGINQIKSLYILRADDADKTTENYLTIAKDNKGYHAFNEFDREDIRIKSKASGTFSGLGKKENLTLRPGDEIHFGEPFPIQRDNKRYKYLRIAKFMEYGT